VTLESGQINISAPIFYPGAHASWTAADNFPEGACSGKLHGKANPTK